MSLPVTAVMLSKEKKNIHIPGISFHNYPSIFNDSAGFLDAKIKSLDGVLTPYFFWLDDDDALPYRTQQDRPRGTCKVTRLASEEYVK